MIRFSVLFVLLTSAGFCARRPSKAPAESPIDRYIAQSEHRVVAPSQDASPGSLYSSNGLLANNARDLRAAQVDDVITIQIADKATAGSKGVLTSSRKSSAAYGVTAAAGPLKSTGALPNLLGANGNNSVQGAGETTRENNLTTTLSARVTHVLPGGNLVIEGSKGVTINSELQTVRVRGIVRQTDISASNTVTSERLSDLEIRIDGRGVVGDAIKRPFILYRLLMGLLPF
jgi:flagellar L-ring protein precursor FlgH